MKKILVHKGKRITKKRITEIKRILAKHWKDGRKAAAVKVCEAWGWKGRNGELKTASALALFRFLQRKGYMKLPFEITYRGRTVTEIDVLKVRDIIARNPNMGRVQISKEVCAAWNWTQRNGLFQDQVCRTLLLKLERAGQITLPEKKSEPPNNAAKRREGENSDGAPWHEEVEVGAESPIKVLQVRRSPYERVYNGLMEQFHFKGCRQSPGAHLKYIAFSGETPVACASFCSAPKNPGLGEASRAHPLANIVCNDRFLILPWARVNGCAGRILSEVERAVLHDWRLHYRWPVLSMEAYIENDEDPEPWLMAGWKRAGETKGIDRFKKKPIHPPKAVYVKETGKGDDFYEQGKISGAHGQAPDQAGAASRAADRDPHVLDDVFGGSEARPEEATRGSQRGGQGGRPGGTARDEDKDQPGHHGHSGA